MKYIISCLAFLFAVMPADLNAQDEQVRDLLKIVAKGQIHNAKAQIPDLLAEYPNDPGVQLLHGVVIDDAFRAFEIYKHIVNKYPTSIWADDAYWRIVQFHAVLGDTTKARYELNNFRKRFPESEYLLPATDVVRSAVGLAKRKKATVAPLGGTSDVAKKIALQKAKSEEARKKIAKPRMTKPATTFIEKTALKPQEQPEAKEEIMAVKEEVLENEIVEETPIEVKAHSYGLQVGIYSTPGAANSEREKFKKQRLITQVIEKDVDGDTMYAVVIGNYRKLSSAENAKIIVQQQCKCNPIIYKK